MRSFSVYLLLILVVSAKAQTATNVTDDKGQKQGYWVKIHPETKRPVYKGTFKDNKPVGTFTYYYEEVDTIHSIVVFTKKTNVAYATLFHQNGKMQAKGKYLSEKKDSIWCFYDEAGTLLSKEFYTEGKKNGKQTIYYQSGNVSEERNFKMDVPNGIYKLYFDDKAVKGEGNYENGKLVGKNSYYFPNGVAAAQGMYNKAGNKHGVWLYKDKNGKIESKDVYDNGKLLNEKEAEEFLKKNKTKAEESKSGTKSTTTSKGTTTSTKGKK